MNIVSHTTRAGFTLIEVLIATALSSLLAASLFYSYAQINKIVVYMTDYVDMFSTVILVDQVFSKDVAGAFFPVQALPTKPKKKAESTPKDTRQKSEKEASPPAEVQEQKPLLKDPFISQNRNNNMSLYSFITNNPKRIFWGAKTGEPKPNVARVVYTLEEDKSATKQQSTFILYRQEGTELNIDMYTSKDSKIERYKIADNIKECKLTFQVQAEPGKDKKEAGEVKTFNDWKVGKDEEDLRSKVKLPHKVIMELTLWDTAKVRERTFTLVAPIMVQGVQTLPEPEAPEQKKGIPQQQKPGQEDNKRKDLLVSSANSVVNNIRSLFGT